MKLLGYLSSLVVLSCLVPVDAIVPLSSVKRVSSTNIVPGRFIIEVAEASQIPGKRSLTSVGTAVILIPVSVGDNITTEP